MSYRLKRTASTFYSLCCVLTACDSSPNPQPPGPRLSLLDSMYLQQGDSLFVARPSLFAIGPRGTLFIGDMAASQVFEFTPQGRHRSTFGRAGRGPGELDWTTSIFFASDSALVVGDDAQRRLVYFKLRDGTSFATTRYRGVLRSGFAMGDSVWLGVLDEDAFTALASGRLFNDSLVYWMPMPSEYRESPAWRGIFTGTQIARKGDAMLVAFNGLNALYLVHDRNPAAEVFVIPAIRRRGISTEAAAILASSTRYTPAQRIGSMSALLGMGVLPSGMVAVVFGDLLRKAGQTWPKAVYVGVVDLPNRKACLDAPLNVTDVAVPLVTLRGDTLYVLDQVLLGNSGVVRIRRFAISLNGCGWVPLSAGKP